MGDFNLTINRGGHVLELPGGVELALSVDNHGRLEVRAREGVLQVFPQSSNVVALTADLTWGHGDPRVAAAQLRVQEFLRQRGTSSNLDPVQVGAVHSDPAADMAVLLVEDLKLLAGGS